ncbi:hypothetical protein [Ilumatobacter sp.]|uniref:hypothetical protein n=1 Tax=Ilumatobacter sp. TaxID=1967498 RepID=UPI003C3FD380
MIAGVLVAGTVGLTSLTASGESIEATDPVAGPLGTLTIDIGHRDGTVTLDLLDGRTFSQPLMTEKHCAQVGYQPVTPASDSTGNLVNFTASAVGSASSTAIVQLHARALGINTRGNCGISGHVIGPGELLGIELGSFFEQFWSDPATPSVFAASAEVKIEKWLNLSGSLTVGYDGGAQGDPVSVARGGATVELQPPDPFRSVTLGSTSRWPLVGLAVGSRTTLDLIGPSTDFEVAVECGEQVTEIGDTGEIATSAVFLRGENGTNPDKPIDACEDVGVIVEIEDGADPGVSEDRVYWNNAQVGVGGTAQQVAGTMSIEWTPVDVGDIAMLDRKIDYDADGAAAYTDVLWCESFSQSTNVDGNVTFTAVLPQIGIGTAGANADGTAPWCLVADDRELVGGQITQTQVYFGSGDPWAR